MNVRLEFSFEFLAGVYTDMLTMNQYFVDVSLTTNTEDPAEQNIAFERAGHFTSEMLAGCVFVETDADSGIPAMLQALGATVMAIPSRPCDQVLGRLLFTKINAIMEGRIYATDLEISSRNGAHLRYLHAGEEGEAPFEGEGWWKDPGPTYCDKRSSKKDKIVKIEKQLSWKDLNLDWPDPSDSDPTVIVKFDATTE